LFKVTRIKSKGDYYVINAKKNDSLFKIISKKTPEIISNLEMLKRGSYYYFDFHNTNKKLTEEKIILLDGALNHLDSKVKPLFVDGKTRIRFTKRFRKQMYTTKNLIGLYYIPNPL
jgi:hypothetical protein